MNSTTRESAIAAELRDDILRGQYCCGERLPSEHDLAERFGVHRSTVRGALHRLEQFGAAFVEARGNPVLKLPRHGLRTRYSDHVRPDRHLTSIPRATLEPRLMNLRKAIVDADGAEASDAIDELTARFRATLRNSLDIEHERANSGGRMGRAGGAR